MYPGTYFPTAYYFGTYWPPVGTLVSWWREVVRFTLYVARSWEGDLER